METYKSLFLFSSQPHCSTPSVSHFSSSQYSHIICELHACAAEAMCVWENQNCTLNYNNKIVYSPTLAEELSMHDKLRQKKDIYLLCTISVIVLEYTKKAGKAVSNKWKTNIYI